MAKKKEFNALFTDPLGVLASASTFFRVKVGDCIDTEQKKNWFDLLITMFFNRKGINAETQDELLEEEAMVNATEAWKSAYDQKDNTLLMQAGLLHYIKGLVIITGPARSSKSRLANVLKVKRPPGSIFAAPLGFSNWYEAQYYQTVVNMCDDTVARTKKIKALMAKDENFKGNPDDIIVKLTAALDMMAKTLRDLNLDQAKNNSDAITARRQKQRQLVIDGTKKKIELSTFADAIKKRRTARHKYKETLLFSQDYNQPFGEVAVINSSGLEFQLRAKALSNHVSLTREEIEFIVMNATNAPIAHFKDVHTLCSILSLAQLYTGNLLEIKWYSEKMELFPLENQVIITKYDTDELHYIKFRNIITPIQLSSRLIVFASTFFGITYVNSMNQNFFDFKKSGSVQGGLPIGYIDAIANFDNILSEFGRSLIVELRDDYSRNGEFEKKLVGAGSVVLVLNPTSSPGISIDIESSRIRPMTDFFDGSFANQMHDDFPVYLKFLEVYVNKCLQHMTTSSHVRDSYQDHSFEAITFSTPSDGR